MIQNEVWKLFYIPDPWNAHKSCYLFTNQAIFLMIYIKKYIEDIRKGFKREYQYTLQNQKFSEAYFSTTIAVDVITKVITITILNSSGPGFFWVIIITVMLDSYNNLEPTLTYMLNVRLYSFPMKNISSLMCRKFCWC